MTEDGLLKAIQLKEKLELKKLQLIKWYSVTPEGHKNIKEEPNEPTNTKLTG